MVSPELCSEYLSGVEPLLVVYDEDCGLCQASIEWLRRRDHRSRFRFIGNDGELPAGVSREETEHTVVVLEDGRKRVRAAAVARLLAELRGWNLVGKLLQLPAISWAADRGYDQFARNRHRISTALGMTSCPAPRRPPRGT
jgi:predicted DCC family thiol-disulfide oxidoreductase YuxK